MQNDEPTNDSSVDPINTYVVSGPDASVSNDVSDQSETIEWTASEFIDHSKSFRWYLALAGITIALAALIFLITKDKISTIVVLVVGILLGIYGARKPKEINYKLNGDGLMVSDKTYPLANYSSFSVIEEGAFRTLAFMPVRRFGLMITVHYDPSDEDKIMNLLGKYLPMDERKKDLLDNLLWKIRF